MDGDWLSFYEVFQRNEVVKHIFDPVLKMTTNADSIANQKEPWVICGDVVIYTNKTLKRNRISIGYSINKSESNPDL